AAAVTGATVYHGRRKSVPIGCTTLFGVMTPASWPPSRPPGRPGRGDSFPLAVGDALVFDRGRGVATDGASRAEEEERHGRDYQRRSPGGRTTAHPHRLLGQGPREPEGRMARDRRGVGARRRQGDQRRARPAAQGRTGCAAPARGQARTAEVTAPGPRAGTW